MTNKKEDKLLASEDYQQKIANGLALGFVDYFSK
jgi:N-acetylmuramoyl-L-alanine amidase